jgi:hypothetical protein
MGNRETAIPSETRSIYCLRSSEVTSILQMLSIYLLMFFLGSMARYSLGDFDDLFESG